MAWVGGDPKAHLIPGVTSPPGPLEPPVEGPQGAQGAHPVHRGLSRAQLRPNLIAFMSRRSPPRPSPPLRAVPAPGNVLAPSCRAPSSRAGHPRLCRGLQGLCGAAPPTHTDAFLGIRNPPSGTKSSVLELQVPVAGCPCCPRCVPALGRARGAGSCREQQGVSKEEKKKKSREIFIPSSV